MGHNRLVSFTGEVLLHLHLPTQPFNGKEKTMFDKLKGLVMKNQTTPPAGANNAEMSTTNSTALDVGPGTEVIDGSSPFGKFLKVLETTATA